MYNSELMWDYFVTSVISLLSLSSRVLLCDTKNILFQHPGLPETELVLKQLPRVLDQRPCHAPHDPLLAKAFFLPFLHNWQS